MRILALDTSTMVQSVAVLGGNPPSVEETKEVKRGHARTLLRTIDSLLSQASTSAAELELVVVGIGPGSFTGLRIGVATAKALCYATNLPIVGVGSLEPLAYAAPVVADSAVVVATDARKKEVYGAIYQPCSGSPPKVLVSPNTFKPVDLASEMVAIGASLVAVGNGFELYADVIQNIIVEQGGRPATLLEKSHWWPSAVALGELGRFRCSESGADDLVSLEPYYIRASDAELNWKKKGK